MTEVHNPKRSQSTAELVKELSREVSELVRQEVALAKAELAEKGKQAGAGAGMLSGPAVLRPAAGGGGLGPGVQAPLRRQTGFGAGPITGPPSQASGPAVD